MMDSTVTFYLPKLSDPARFDDIDPEEDWTPFRSARGQSIPHTYVRLRQAGNPVQISNRPPSGGIAVVFAGDMRRFGAARLRRDSTLVVCVQTDRRVPEVSRADVIVEHNGLREDGLRHVFIPNWPQPGMLPRDTNRVGLQTVTYKGAAENLHPDFLTGQWARDLAQLGLTFVVDAPIERDDERLRGLGSAIEIGSSTNWHDYSRADVTLAVRPDARHRYRHKPAVKLVNAWRAGTPALLGPEPAYQELRRSDLDYIEVSSAEEAAEALARLRGDPALYRDMVENGRERAAAFSVASITERWQTLLFETLVEQSPPQLPKFFAAATVPARRLLRGVSKRVLPP